MRDSSASGEQWFGEAPRRSDRALLGRVFLGSFVVAAIATAVAQQTDPTTPHESLAGIATLTFVFTLAITWTTLLLAERSRRRGLALRGGILSFAARGQKTAQQVLDLREPFGVTALANRSRSRASLAITTSTGSFYVSGRFDEQTRGAWRATLASAFTVASDERALDAAAPDGFPLELDGTTFGQFFAALRALDPRCTSRLFLSGHRGDAVTVDGRALTVGERLFDLGLALEWHGALFREQAFGAMSVFQLTFVRQGEQEVAFVSLMPALAAPSCPGDVVATAEPELERAVLRDMGLLNVGVEDAPPAHLRVAIERVFMLPLRAALDGAPAAAVGARSGETRAAS